MSAAAAFRRCACTTRLNRHYFPCQSRNCSLPSHRQLLRRQNVSASSRAEDTEPVRYTGARLQSDEIRLIELLPGTWEDPIRCSMFNATQTTARYQAPSCVWESTRKTRSIVINSLPYPTTFKLESALRLLREHNKVGLTLWINVLCIDQDGLEQ